MVYSCQPCVQEKLVNAEDTPMDSSLLRQMLRVQELQNWGEGVVT